jgi:hypothetical protein
LKAKAKAWTIRTKAKAWTFKAMQGQGHTKIFSMTMILDT